MLLALRKIIFYLLLPLYFFVTPYVIFYALGYNINPQEAQLVKTGLIFIETLPSNAAIYIEGRRFPRKTPAAVRHLLPGRYKVRVIRKGYEPWEKEVDIAAEKAARLAPVILIPKTPQESAVSPKLFDGFIPMIFDSRLVAWTGNTLSGLWRLDLVFDKETSIGREILQGNSFEILEPMVRQDSDFILFRTKKNGQEGYYGWDLTEKKNSVDLSGLIPKDPDFIDWDDKDTHDLYFMKDGNLSHIDLRRLQLNPNTASDMLGLGVEQNRLYFLKKDFSLIEATSRAPFPESFQEDKEIGEKIFSRVSARYYQIESFKKDLLQKNLLVFRSDAGALISNRLPYYHVDKGVLGVQYAFDSDAEKLLFWTEDQIGFIDFTRLSGSLFEKGPSGVLVYREGKKISQAVWAYEDSHVLFLDEDQIFLMEAEGPRPYRLNRLASVKSGTAFVYNERNHALYYLNPGRRLIRRELAAS